jgi:hypothetical protein
MDYAKDLLLFWAGPLAFGPIVLIGVAYRTLKNNERSIPRALLAIGSGTLALAMSVFFVVLAAPTVFTSWSENGTVQPVLALLSLTWFTALAVLIVSISQFRVVIRYLAECFHPSERPVWLRNVSQWVWTTRGVK